MAEESNKIERPQGRFDWTATKHEAALLLAEDELTHDKICAKLDISRSTLWHWRRHPEFAAEMTEHMNEIREAVRSHGLAIMETRVRHLQRRHEKLLMIIDERAESPEMQDVPGGKSGLLAREIKSLGFGENAERVDEYTVDTGLLKELREHEKQAAQELGQWTEKHETTGEQSIKVESSVSVEELAALARLCGRADVFAQQDPPKQA